MDNFEIYEGRTDNNRKKTYLVFDYECGYPKFNEARAAARHYFRVSDDHIQICVGYVIKDELFLENLRKRPAGAKVVRVACWK